MKQRMLPAHRLVLEVLSGSKERFYFWRQGVCDVKVDRLATVHRKNFATLRRWGALDEQYNVTDTGRALLS
jgi:hypothetical protein